MQDLDALYRQNADTVFRYLSVKTGSDDLAEELTQETFYQAVKSIDRYDGSCAFSTWLIGIAKNVLRSHYRKQRQKGPSLEDIPEPSVRSAEDTILEGIGVESVLSVIHRIPEPGREILYLRLLGNLSFQQIGTILNRTETWARVNYYRAKQTLIKELSDEK